MDRQGTVRALRGYLLAQGFEGRGRELRLEWPELIWMVELDLIPKSARLGISVGVCPLQLAANGWPSATNDCPIILYPDGGGEPFGLDHWQAWHALDAGSNITDHQRMLTLSEIADAIGELARRVSDRNGLKQMADLGHLNGFVHKDARELLEGGD